MPNPVELRLIAYGADSTHVPSRPADPAMVGRLKGLALLGANDLPISGTFVVQHPHCKEARDLRQKQIHLIHVGGVERVVLRSVIVDVNVSKDGSTIDFWVDGDRKAVGLWLFRCDRRPRESAVFLKRFKDASVSCEFMRLPPGVTPPAETSVQYDVPPRPTVTAPPLPPPPVLATPAPVVVPPAVVSPPPPPPMQKSPPKAEATPKPSPVIPPKPVVEEAPPEPRKIRTMKAKRKSAESADVETSVPPPPDITEALVVSIAKVRPFAPSVDPRFPGQPRVWFNPERLEKLALSIRKHGQRTPIMAKRLVPPEDGKEFELIDGERRWRALGMVKATHVAITVSCPKSKAEQHMSSLIQNFCREGHTHMEISNAIASQVEVGKSLTDIAAAIGQSIVTVCNLHSLQRLVPELKPLLDPPTPKSDRIRLQEAVELSRIDPDKQVEIWENAKEQPTRALIRATIKALGREFIVHKRARKVKPSDYSAALSRKIAALQLATTNLRQMSSEDVRIAVQAMNGQCKEQIALLTELIKSLDEEKQLLSRLGVSARKAVLPASATS